MRLRPSALGVPAVAIALVTVLVGCGSGSAASAAAGAGVTRAEAAGTVEDAGTSTVDPCHWFTADEMGAILGFKVTAAAEDTPLGYGKECAYNSDTEFTKVTILPMSAAQYDSLKAGTATYSTRAIVAVKDVGDDAYDNSQPDQTNGSLSLNAKQGSEAVEVSLATANDKIGDLAAARKIVIPVTKKVLGG